ncbi:MAG: hypothetical protein Q4A32_11110 [Lachnospiraceae bacterium]|nr:hypothetical protein [Lachnospiraceae bacterium]
MNKIERMILLPLTVAVGAAGAAYGFVIYNKMAKVKLADAALKEMEAEAKDSEETTDAEEKDLTETTDTDETARADSDGVEDRMTKEKQMV